MPADAKGIAAFSSEEAGAGTGISLHPSSHCAVSQELCKAHSHLPGLREATRYKSVGILGAPLRVPHLPPPAAAARFHCGGSLSLQTLGGSCKQRQTELRGWIRMSFSISPAALGAPAKGTADTHCDPTLSCGGRAGFSSLRAQHPNHTQVLGVQCRVVAPQEPRTQPPTPAWHQHKRCRGRASGSSPALSSQAGMQVRGQHCQSWRRL